MPRLSIQDFARSRGKSRTAIYKAIREGRIKEALERNDAGKFVVDAELADVELARNTEPSMQRDPDAIRAGIEANRDPTPGPLFREQQPTAPAAAAAGAEEKKPAASDKSAQSLAGSRAALAAYDARLRRLDYEERIGSLISIDIVKVELFRSNRMIRDALLALPGNVAPSLVGEQSEDVIRATLAREIGAVLQSISNEFKAKP